MARVEIADGTSLYCDIDDFLWPWTNATPVLMVHGFARTSAFWSRWVPSLAAARRIYRLELRGCAGSDRPADDYAYEPQTILGDVIAAMDELALAKVHWVGESSSGILGIVLAATYPDRVASLVLCDTPAKVSTSAALALDQATSWAAIRHYGLAEWSRRTLHLRLDTTKASPEMQAWCIDQMRRTPDQVAARYNECFLGADVRPLLAQVKAPVLLLAGDKSRASADQQETLRRGLEKAELHFFNGYGHGVNLLAPEECARVSAAFWDRLP